MINFKPEDLNNLTPQGMIACKIISKEDRDNPINIAMAEVIKEQARAEKIDNDRKADPDNKSKRMAAAYSNLSTGIYGIEYGKLDEDQRKHIDELAKMCI